MKIASFCIKHKVTTILAFVIIAVFGVVFYSNLKLALMPNMEFPQPMSCVPMREQGQRMWRSW